MKRILLLLLALFSLFTSKAQTFNNTGSGLNQVIIDKDDIKGEEEADEETVDTFSLENVSMDMQDRVLQFSMLPKSSILKVFVTDSRGNEMITKNIDSKKNKISIRKFPKGIFFATLIDEIQERRKAFVVNIE